MKKRTVFGYIAAASMALMFAFLLIIFCVNTDKLSDFSAASLVFDIFLWIAFICAGTAAALDKRKMLLYSLIGITVCTLLCKNVDSLTTQPFFAALLMYGKGGFWTTVEFVIGPLLRLAAFGLLTVLMYSVLERKKKNGTFPMWVWLLPTLLEVLRFVLKHFALISLSTMYTAWCTFADLFEITAVFAVTVLAMFYGTDLGLQFPIVSKLAEMDAKMPPKPVRPVFTQNGFDPYQQPQYQQPQYQQPQYQQPQQPQYQQPQPQYQQPQPQYQQPQYQQPQYQPQPPRPEANPTDEIMRAKSLMDKGIITPEEFEAIKRRQLR